MELKFRPLIAFPRPLTKNRTNARFRASYEATLDLLREELSIIKARNAVIQMALTDAKIRKQDGLPYKNSMPDHPGVVLTFEKWVPTGRYTPKKEPLGIYQPFSMPADKFFDWTDNLRGIALTLNALRDIDRYGVTQSFEQYSGFGALPPATQGEDFVSEAEAAAWLNAAVYPDCPEDLMTAMGQRKRAYQIAAQKFHPDNKNSGDPANFRRLQNAKRILGI